MARRAQSLSIEAPDVLFLEGSALGHQILSGSVTLWLEHGSEALASLSVTLTGTAAFADGREPRALLRNELTVATEALTAGSHSFSFTFEVSNCAAPSEKCAYGSVTYHVDAKAELLGVSGGSLNASKEMNVVSLSGTRDQPPEGLDICLEGMMCANNCRFTGLLAISEYREGIGHLSCGVWSPLCSVGGFLSSDYIATGWTHDVRKLESDLLLIQHISIDDVEMEPETFTLYRLDHAKRQKSWASGSSGHPEAGHDKAKIEIPTKTDCVYFSAKGAPKQVDVYRLAWHEKLRPTTLGHTDSPIRVWHEVALRLLYAKPPYRTAFRAKLAQPITLASCACMQDSMLLPAYSWKTPKSYEPRKERCICSMKINEVLIEQKQWVEMQALRMEAYIAGKAPHPTVNEVAQVPLPPKLDE